MNERHEHRIPTWSRLEDARYPVLAVLLAIALLGSAMARPAGAQSSPGFKLLPGSLTSIGGTTQASGKVIVGGSGYGAAHSRSSSATRDVIGGFIGGAFSSQAIVSFTTQAGEFSLLGVPVTAPDPTFGGLFEELGGADVTQWRLGHWSPADTAYHEAVAGNLGPIVTGEGLWLITPTARTMSVTGLPAPNPFVDITLGAGPGDTPAWNQVANPYLYPVDISRMIVSNGSTFSILNNPANTLTEQVAKVWDTATDAYVNATTINGRSGFWVKRLGPGTVHLIVVAIASTSGSPAPPVAVPSGAAWAVSLVARQDGRACEPLVVGVADVAEGKWNPLCRSLTPSPPGRFLSLAVPRRDWGPLSDRYVHDFRAPSEPTEWDVVLDGGAAPGEVALEATAFDLPAGVRLVIEDPREGWSREIVPGASALTVPAISAERRLRLRAVAGAPGGLTPAREGLLHVYPSPFSSTAGVALSLARAGDLTVNVYDAQGRHVRSIERPGATPGEHVLVWDGRDGAGRSAAPGVYLARWTAGVTQGTARLVKVE